MVVVMPPGNGQSRALRSGVMKMSSTMMRMVFALSPASDYSKPVFGRACAKSLKPSLTQIGYSAWASDMDPSWGNRPPLHKGRHYSPN